MNPTALDSTYSVRHPGTGRRRERGVALVVVLWVVLVLSLLIGGFAFTMHVETQLQSYHRKALKADALTRSGLELARLALQQDAQGPDADITAPNQAWVTNRNWFVEHELGEGKIWVTITDEESKLPLNRLTPGQWRRLLDLLGVDPADADVIADSVADWIDDNDLHMLNGAEDEYYESLVPPYRAKNAPVDHVEELLLVRGVTKELMYGVVGDEEEETIPGLVDLLTTTTSGRINVNTASAIVLKAALGLDDLQLESILTRRPGPDGEWGTDDDQPFRNLGEFYALLGNLTDEVRNQLNEWLTVRSTHFTVRVTAEVAGVRRTARAIVSVGDGGHAQVVMWREEPGS